jgi:hypothetical protein
MFTFRKFELFAPPDTTQYMEGLTADAGPWAGAVSNPLRRLSAFDVFSLKLSCCSCYWKDSLVYRVMS